MPKPMIDRPKRSPRRAQPSADPPAAPLAGSATAPSDSDPRYPLADVPVTLAGTVQPLRVPEVLTPLHAQLVRSILQRPEVDRLNALLTIGARGDIDTVLDEIAVGALLRFGAHLRSLRLEARQVTLRHLDDWRTSQPVPAEVPSTPRLLARFETVSQLAALALGDTELRPMANRVLARHRNYTREGLCRTARTYAAEAGDEPGFRLTIIGLTGWCRERYEAGEHPELELPRSPQMIYARWRTREDFLVEAGLEGFVGTSPPRMDPDEDWTAERCEQALRRVLDEQGLQRARKADYEQGRLRIFERTGERLASVTHVTKRLGGWAAAIKRVGRLPGRARIEDSDLTDSLVCCAWAQGGRLPSGPTYSAFVADEARVGRHRPSYGTLVDRLGSWTDAKRVLAEALASGSGSTDAESLLRAAERRRSQPPLEQVADGLRRVVEHLGGVLPTQQAYGHMLRAGELPAALECRR